MAINVILMIIKTLFILLGSCLISILIVRKLRAGEWLVLLLLLFFSLRIYPVSILFELGKIDLYAVGILGYFLIPGFLSARKYVKMQEEMVSFSKSAVPAIYIGALWGAIPALVLLLVVDTKVPVLQPAQVGACLVYSFIGLIIGAPVCVAQRIMIFKYLSKFR